MAKATRGALGVIPVLVAVAVVISYVSVSSAGPASGAAKVVTVSMSPDHIAAPTPAARTTSRRDASVAVPSTAAPVPTTPAPVPGTPTKPVSPTRPAPVPATTAPVPATTAPVPATAAPVPTTAAPVATTTTPPTTAAATSVAAASVADQSTYGYGCDDAVAYLDAHAAPGYQIVCPGYAEGHEAMTCNNAAPCPGQKVIVIADPCPAAYRNEASNSQVFAGLSDAPIDPFGAC